MRKHVLYCIVLFSFLSCAPHQDKSQAAAGNTGTGKTAEAPGPDENYLMADNDSVLIPSFNVAVKLSEKAEEKILNAKESILVTAWFSGLPRDTSSKEFREWGEVFIRSFSVELDTGRTARFEGLKFSRAVYDSLAGKDIKVLVSVYSGRKAFPDNLLDCEILSEKMSAVKGRTMQLPGKLISESTVPQ